MFQTVTRILMAGLGMALFVVTVSAQNKPIGDHVRGKPSELNHFIETPANWTHPRTAWGDPDLEGTWPIPAGVNLVRTCPRGGGPGRGGRAGGAPGGAAAAGGAQGGGRAGAPGGAPTAPPCDLNQAWLSDEEWKARLTQAEQLAKEGDRATQLLAKGDFGGALQGGVTDPQTPLRQRSTIMDPPNGQLPELTQEGLRRSALMRSSWAMPGEKQTWDHWTDFDSWDRCITRGMPTSMMAYRYNNGIKIFQAPGMVVLSLEMIHEDRIVYTDGRPPLKAAHQHYMGEPRGRWEGTTLVVETTNYKPGPSGTNLGVYGTPPGIPGGNRWPVSEQMKTTERFTRLNNDYILYEMTVEDPIVMQRPYTVRYPLKLDNTYEWWEYGCHEGNRTIRDYINASRAERGLPVSHDPNDPTAPGSNRGSQP
jgi:hypothetical protein